MVLAFKFQFFILLEDLKNEKDLTLFSSQMDNQLLEKLLEQYIFSLLTSSTFFIIY